LFAPLQSAEQAAVPQRVQVGAEAVPAAVAQVDLCTVATAVVRVAGMHRLVYVAYEVDDEFQRLQALLAAAAAVAQNRGLVVDRFDHAVAAIRAVALTLVAAGVFADVHVVPARAAPAQVRIVGAQLVGPGGDARQRALVRVLHPFQQPFDFGPGGGGEGRFGDVPHQAVAARA